MSRASMPPTMKKNIAATPYMMPSFLWSTVNTHERHPVVCTGRRKTPRVLDGVTGGGTVSSGAVVAGTGRSMMAMLRSLLSVPGQQVRHDLVDMVLGQRQVGHPAGLAVGRREIVGFGVH